MESKRSWEFSALPVVVIGLGALAIIMAAFDAGLWAWLALGVLVAVSLVLLAVWWTSRPHRVSDSPPESAAPRVDGVHRVLVIADESCSARELGATIAASREGMRTSAFVVAPVLGSRIARVTGDEHPYEEAAKHLDATLKALAELRVEADGHVGSHDPLQATDEGLREFAADEIVFALHPDGDENWLEHGVVDAAQARYSIPVRELELASTR